MSEVTQAKRITISGERVSKGDKVYDGSKWVTVTGWRMGQWIEVETASGEREYPLRKRLSK